MRTLAMEVEGLQVYTLCLHHDSTGSPTRDTVTVQDVVDITFNSGSASYGPSRTYLAAQWSITTTQGLSVKRWAD